MLNRMLLKESCYPHSYCPACWEVIYQAISKKCEKEYRLTVLLPEEAKLVQTHNERARQLGREATLTITEWIKTLEHYEWRQAADSNAEHHRLSRLANNQERFQQAIDLHLRDIPQKEIASRLGISIRTLQRWIERGSCPGSERRHKRRSIFDPYAPYVLSHWKQGCRDITLLWQEIQAQGFPGQIRTVYRFIRSLCQEPIELPAPSVLDRVSVQEAIWLIARPLSDLGEDERADLQELCQASSKLSTLHTLVQSFGQMVYATSIVFPFLTLLKSGMV